MPVLFSNERQKWDEARCEGRWGGAERSRGKGNWNQNPMDEKYLFSIKGENDG